MKYKVLSPISIGERREVGEVVDLDKKTAERYSDELEAFVEEEVVETETETNEEVVAGEVGEVVEKPKKKKGKK
jgi:hypothetical protein